MKRGGHHSRLGPKKIKSDSGRQLPGRLGVTRRLGKAVLKTLAKNVKSEFGRLAARGGRGD